MEEVQLKKSPSTGMIIGIIIAVVIVIIIVAILIWMFSRKQTVDVVPVAMQAQPGQPVVAGSRRVAPSNSVGGTRKREGATYRQVLGVQR
jgi:flagellar basal body-associated protein FliL